MHGSESLPSNDALKAKQAMPGAAARLDPTRSQPLFKRSSDSEDKMEQQEPGASILQERRRRAADAQCRLAERHEKEGGNGCRQEDHDADSCSLQTERFSTEEYAEKAPLISGPQSMLNVLKARADSTIEASGDSPSFADRESHSPSVALASRSCRADLRVFQ